VEEDKDEGREKVDYRKRRGRRKVSSTSVKVTVYRY
jgi:hypothetical protein